VPAGRQRSERPRSRAVSLTGSGTAKDAGTAEDAGGRDRAAARVAEDPEAAAREICLRLLTLSPRTRAQLADALRRRGVPDQAAETVLDRFTEAGLIDDPAFARAWVESRHYSRGLSRRALSAELRRRGVADNDVHEAVETLDPDQEVATARQLIARKAAATRGQPPEVRIRKLMGVLARKGYGSALAYRVVRETLEHEGADLAADVPEPDFSEPDAAGPDGFGPVPDTGLD
jgi:regulatory protein